MTVLGALPPPVRREQRDNAHRLLELVHGSDGHRKECRREQAAQHRALTSQRPLEQAIHEVDGEERVRGLHQTDDQHLDAGIVNADAARHGHDPGDDAGEERGACVGQRQADAARDLVCGGDDDVMIVELDVFVGGGAKPAVT